MRISVGFALENLVSIVLTAVGGQPASLPATEKVYDSLPLTFESNQGQTDARVKFLARVSGYTLFVTSDEIVFAARNGPVERMKLIAPRRTMRMEPLDRQAGISNYFIGNDPSKWRTSIPNYARLALRGVYTGIDLIFYGNGRRLEYDWVVAPGADPKQIRVKWDGPVHLTKNAAGDLVLNSSLVQQKPVILQDGNRIDGGYVVRGSQVAFEIGEYDITKPLVIDPVLAYSTFLGGNATDLGSGIAVDGAGSAYVTGRTISTNFPPVNILQPGNDYGVSFGAFVIKINPAGSAMVYSTYLGGNGNNWAAGIALDSARNAYVTGTTYSTNFPTANPLQAGNGGAGFGGSNAFVTKLDATGSALVYSTYLGGTADNGNGIAVDGAGNAYLTGSTMSTNFPTAHPLQARNGGGGFPDAFVTKINAEGSAMAYSTYLGGNNVDIGNGIAVDNAGNAYVTGSTHSVDFPTARPLQARCGTCGGIGETGFVTKINADGSAFVYSTYLGGSTQDVGYAIAVDASGNAYVTGETSSTNFPTANPFQAGNHGGRGVFLAGDAFVTKINATGSAFVYSTYLGGAGNELGYGIAVDSAGNAYVTGSTTSADFPTLDPVQAGNKGNVFESQLNAAGSALVHSTYLGASGDFTADAGAAIAVDGAGNVYVTGTTSSTDFPTVNPVQEFYGRNIDAFVLSIAIAAPPPPPSICLGCVVNAASFAMANGLGVPVAPGSLVTIYTSALGVSAATSSTPSLPVSLSGVSVTVNSVAAPMLAVSPAGPSPSVSVQIPFEALPVGQEVGDASVILFVNGVASAPVHTPLVQSAPGIFTIPATGSGNAILVFVDPTDNLAKIAAPASASSTTGYPTAPIPRGSDAFFYAAGLGAMTPQVADGSSACTVESGLCAANFMPTVLVGGIMAPVSFAGQAAGSPGVYQINITIPQGTPTGDSVPLTIRSSDGRITSNSATIAVQ